MIRVVGVGERTRAREGVAMLLKERVMSSVTGKEIDSSKFGSN